MTKMKNYTDRLHGEGASGIMELQKSNKGGALWLLKLFSVEYGMP